MEEGSNDFEGDTLNDGTAEGTSQSWQVFGHTSLAGPIPSLDSVFEQILSSPFLPKIHPHVLNTGLPALLICKKNLASASSSGHALAIAKYAIDKMHTIRDFIVLHLQCVYM